MPKQFDKNYQQTERLETFKETEVKYPEKKKAALPEEKKETKPEIRPEKEPAIKKAEVKEKPQITPVSKIVTPLKVIREISPLQREIEKVLEADLGDLYQKLNPQQKTAFKAKGEVTASKITKMIQAAKIKIKKIWRLIRSWLKILPGINRFFLEQEIKIKTDQIIALAQRQKKK